MKKWIDRWNTYWFPTTTTTALALCRIIAVAAQLFWFFPSLRYHLNLLEKNPEFIEPQLLIRAITAIVPRDVLFTPSGLSVLYWVTFVAGAAALVGLFSPAHPFSFLLWGAGYLWLRDIRTPISIIPRQCTTFFSWRSRFPRRVKAFRSMRSSAGVEVGHR